MEIYFKDLNKETQEKVLNLYGYKTEQEGNFDISPLFILYNGE